MRNNIVASLALLACAANGAFAQSMQVLGSGQEARRCSDAAQMAASIGSASRSDLDDCNRALETVALRQRDRAATLVNRGILESALGDHAPRDLHGGDGRERRRAVRHLA